MKNFIIVLSLFGFTMCSAVKHYPSDNIVEEEIEEYIQFKTGLDLDISPMSPEND